MNTTTQATRTKFQHDMDSFAQDLSTREFTGTPGWAIVVQLRGIADSYDISELTLEFLQNELKLCKSHFFLDGHNWSDFQRAMSDFTIQIIERLSFRKEEVGA